VVREKLLLGKPAPEFKRVVIPLRDMLSGDFLTEYIKNGKEKMGRRAVSKNGLPTDTYQGTS
jgi:ribonuclease P/MRP protein subunit RPP40